MNQLLKITGALALGLVSTAVFAQDKVKMNLYYNYSLPSGGLKNNFIDRGSARGFGADVIYYFNPKFGLGGSVNYQDFYQKYPRSVYKLADGSDISAVVSNSLQTTPIMVKGVYSPLAGKAGFVQPYVTAGAGVNIINYSQLLGEFNNGSSLNAGFIAQAGAGVKVPLGKMKRAGILLGATYNYAPYSKYDIGNVNSINFQAGVQFGIK